MLWHNGFETIKALYALGLNKQQMKETILSVSRILWQVITICMYLDSLIILILTASLLQTVFTKKNTIKQRLLKCYSSQQCMSPAITVILRLLWKLAVGNHP
jgi:hypothetical protein